MAARRKKNPGEPTKLEAAHQALLDAVVADMAEKGSGWVRDWSFGCLPFNGTTGMGYGGRNTRLLMHAMRAGGYRDPRFATFKQAVAAGCHIEKGQHGWPIECWKMLWADKTDPDARIKQPKTPEETEAYRTDPNLVQQPRCVGSFTVFNVEQMDVRGNLFPAKTLEAIEPDIVADGLIAGSPCPVHEAPSNEAFYLPDADSIWVPQRNQFTSIGSFCRTLLHEQGHATGHPTRLERPNWGNNRFGTPKYAFEELVAEFSAMFTANAIGLDLSGALEDKPLSASELAESEAVRNHSEYLRNWARGKGVELSEDGSATPSKLLMRAASAGSRASTYLIEECLEPALGPEFFRGRMAYPEEEHAASAEETAREALEAAGTTPGGEVRDAYEKR